MLIDNLNSGIKQHVVTYGTSLTEGGEWVNQLRAFFDKKYPGLVTVTNSGKSGMWSGWGVENLDERIIQKNPDAVFIEFGINDAYLPYNTTVEQAKANLENMIDRTLAAHPTCQIILMVMNPPVREHLEIRPKIEDYYRMYRDVAKERKLLLVDHYPIWKDILDNDPETFARCMPDGIHPNGLGSEKVTTPNILAALFGPPTTVSPGGRSFVYGGYISIEKSPIRVTFDRLVKNSPYHIDSPCTRIRFKTDAAVLSLKAEYPDQAKHPEHRAWNSEGVCLVDGAPALTFTRHHRQGERLEVDLSTAAPIGVHEYEIILPIGDRVEFGGIVVNAGAKMFAPTPEPVCRYVAYGDSITQGFFAGNAIHTYAYLLAREKGWQLVNFGFAGRTAVASDGAVAGKLQPDVITILLGVNDCVGKVPLADFKSNYRESIQNVRKECSKVPIYAITPLNVPGKWAGMENLEEYRTAIREIVAKSKDEHLFLIEGPELIPNDGKFFQDGVHPNDAGFAEMAHNLAARMHRPQQPVKRLFVDDTFVESATDLVRRVHPLRRHSANPLIVQDRSYECHTDFRYHPSVCMWSNPVLRDPVTGKFRMWYTGYADLDEQGRESALILYAESDDGIKWTKPDLELVEWKGSSRNNIVMVCPPMEDGELRLLDTPNIIYRPEESDPKNRYRLLVYLAQKLNAAEGICLFRSEDGLHWEPVKENAVPNGREFNSFFWDARQQKYIGTVRIRHPEAPPRQVGYTESKNFIDWSKAKVILSPKELNTRFNLPGDEVYGLVSFPYESHYLGFLHTYHADRRVEVQLMAATDPRKWSFVGEGEYVLPNDPRGGYGQGMMSTQSGPPIRVGDELWVYIGISPKAHDNPEFAESPGQQKRVIGLATIRLDGFTSIHADEEPGTLVTKPFQFDGKAIFVNVQADKGELQVEAIDEDNGSYPALPIQEDNVRKRIQWQDRAPSGHTIRLRFTLTNADLYSFWTE